MRNSGFYNGLVLLLKLSKKELEFHGSVRYSLNHETYLYHCFYFHFELGIHFFYDVLFEVYAESRRGSFW